MNGDHLKTLKRVLNKANWSLTKVKIENVAERPRAENNKVEITFSVWIETGDESYFTELIRTAKELSQHAETAK